jgi:multiple sugar transport system ATP-binding protein
VAAFRERHQIKPGERIHLRPRAQAAHLFDAQTGTRL